MQVKLLHNADYQEELLHVHRGSLVYVVFVVPFGYTLLSIDSKVYLKYALSFTMYWIGEVGIGSLYRTPKAKAGIEILPRFIEFCW